MSRAELDGNVDIEVALQSIELSTQGVNLTENHVHLQQTLQESAELAAAATPDELAALSAREQSALAGMPLSPIAQTGS